MTMLLSRRNLILLSSGYAALTASGLHADTTAATTAPAASDAPIVITDLGIGEASAKLQMSEYLSLTCPHCEHFHAELYPKMKADYIDTGKLRLTLHEVYFDQLGLLGAMTARCGGELRYVGIIDMLYGKQRDWAAAADMGSAVDALKKIARLAGMTDDQVDVCLKDQKMAEALVQHYKDALTKDFPNDSFQGTPSFIVNGTVNTEINANMAYADLQKVLDGLLAK